MPIVVESFGRDHEISFPLGTPLVDIISVLMSLPDGSRLVDHYGEDDLSVVLRESSNVTAR